MFIVMQNHREKWHGINVNVWIVRDDDQTKKTKSGKKNLLKM